jgi:hypothetical protein
VGIHGIFILTANFKNENLTVSMAMVSFVCIGSLCGKSKHVYQCLHTIPQISQCGMRGLKPAMFFTTRTVVRQLEASRAGNRWRVMAQTAILYLKEELLTPSLVIYYSSIDFRLAYMLLNLSSLLYMHAHNTYHRLKDHLRTCKKIN